MATTKPVGNTESKKIDELLKRPALYRNVDGTEEINVGIMGLGLASLRLLYPALGGWDPGGLAGLVYLGVLGVLVHLGSKAIKKRLTYPRTGFAEPRCTNSGGKWVVLGAIMVISGLFSALIALMALRRLSGGPALVGCGGVLVAVAFAIGIGKRVPWKRWVAAIFGLGSMVIAFVPAGRLASVFQGVPIPKMLSPSVAGALFIEDAWIGVVFLTSGLITLRQYIRSTRPAEPDSE
jgi:hypothetical protein